MKEKGWKKCSKCVLTTIMIIAVTLPSFIGAIGISGKTVPSVDRNYEEACEWIRDNTEDDAVIASWWDKGYFLNYYAERDTLMDGGTFDGRYYYWVSCMLMTDDAALSEGIARMLANYGLEVSYYMDYYGYAYGSYILRQILPMSRDDAYDYLVSEIPEMNDENANRLLDMTHKECERPIYLLVSSDMIDIGEAMNYYAGWDFNGEAEPLYEYKAGYVMTGCMLLRMYNQSDDVGNWSLSFSQADPIGLQNIAIWKLN